MGVPFLPQTSTSRKLEPDILRPQNPNTSREIIYSTGTLFSTRLLVIEAVIEKNFNPLMNAGIHKFHITEQFVAFLRRHGSALHIKMGNYQILSDKEVSECVYPAFCGEK